MENLESLTQSYSGVPPGLIIIGILFLLSLILIYYILRERKTVRDLKTEIQIRDSELGSYRRNFETVEYELRGYKKDHEQLKEKIEDLKFKEVELISEKRALETRLEERANVIETFKDQLENNKAELSELNKNAIEDQRKISQLVTALENERSNSQEKITLLNEAKDKLSEQFENLGNKIFENNTKRFSDQNKVSLENLLNPLREQIKDFDRKISDTYEKESKERVSILNQIEHLKNLNNKISQDAINLTNALKGETKTQGAWGEVVLEKILEMSGLVKGREYETQVSHFRAWDDKMLRPDVIVNLPEGKQVVIDSKVSLKAYEEYSSLDNKEEKKTALTNHINSINNHIKNLGSKSYEDLKGVNSLNYVLMFIPIESAFMVAIENDKEIFKNAFSKNIILVCPSTLLATLRTVQSIWQYEYQNRNAQDIADRAGKLFDRFVDFVNHLEKVGKSLEQATKSYEDSIKALSTGKGNLIKQVSQLEELGIKNRKQISPDVLEKSETFEPGDNKKFQLEITERDE